jgi:hypothetical protein
VRIEICSGKYNEKGKTRNQNLLDIDRAIRFGKTENKLHVVNMILLGVRTEI